MNEIWGQIQQILQKNLNPGLFKVWITPLEALVDGSVLRLTAPNDFVAAWVRDRLQNDILNAAEEVMGVRPTLCVEASKKKQSVPARNIAKAVSSSVQGSGPMSGPMIKTSTVQQAALPFTHSVTNKVIDWRFDFNDFVVGPNNHLAFAASQGICHETLATDTLFLSSAPGLGKTHLMHSVGKQLCLSSNKSNLRTEYLTAEEFATRLIASLKAKEVDRFKARYRDVDLLLLEDIHFLQGKEKMQDEVLATIKALQSRGSRVVLSSSFAPRDLKDVDNQLVSRFCSGFMAVIDKPNFATRKELFQSKARLYQVDLPENVTDVLAENIRTDVRQIESCLHNLLLKARVLNERISLEMAWDVISHYASNDVVMDIDGIIRCICQGFGLSPEQLNSRSRRRELVVARNTAFFLARKHTDLSLKEIGNHFNRRHSTVLKGITNLEREMSKDTPLGRQVTSTMNMIERNGRVTF